MLLSVVLIFVIFTISTSYGCSSKSAPTPIPTQNSNPSSSLSTTTTISPKHTTLLCKKGCTIGLNNDLPDPEPLLIVPGSTEFLYPNSSDSKIYMKCGETVELACTIGLDKWKNKTINATCDDENLFYTGNTPQNLFQFKRFNCSHCIKDGCNPLPDHTIRKTSRNCSTNLTFIEIGFDIGNRFFKIIDICYNESLVSTLYVQYKLNPANLWFQHNIGMPPFDDIFQEGKNVEHFYKKNVQRRQIAIILNSTTKADSLIPIKNYSYFSEGQLAPMRDFVYGSQQLSTFYFLNVAPQWTNYNEGNWMKILSGIRTFVAKRNLNVDVYTGTHGVLSLSDDNGLYHDIYLNITKNNSNLPIPKLFYKIVVEQQTNSGFALITLNNPNITISEIERDCILCPDVSDVISWINWNRTDIEQGYTYACRVSDFVFAIKQLTQLSHISRLLL